MPETYTIAPITSDAHESAKAEARRSGRKLYRVIGDAVLHAYGNAKAQKSRARKKGAA